MFILLSSKSKIFILLVLFEVFEIFELLMEYLFSEEKFEFNRYLDITFFGDLILVSLLLLLL